MKKIRFTLWVALFLVATNSTFSQNYDQPLSTAAIALGGQQLFISDAFSASGNPALCAKNEEITNRKLRLGIMVRNQYLLNTLKNGGAGLNICFNKSDGIGVNLQYEGTENLRKNILVMAYAKKISNRVFMGVSLYYLNLFEQSIGNKNFITAKAGCYFQPNKKIGFAFTVFNPIATKLTQLTPERIPSNMISGINYEISKQLKCYLSYSVGLHEPNTMKLGMSYSSSPMIDWFLGCNTTNDIFSFGAIFKLKTLKIQVAMGYNQRLGISPAMGFEWGH